MTVPVGNIEIVLTLDDKEFKTQARLAGPVLNNLKQQLQSVADSTTRVERRFTSLGSVLRGQLIMFQALKYTALDINQVFLSLPRAVLTVSGEFERLTVLMKGLSKEADESLRNMEALSNKKFIVDLALKSPFEVKDLTHSFVRLKAAGLDPTKGAMDALTNSVARFGGSSQEMYRAAIGIQQMLGKGVVSMEELRQQVGEAVPTAIRHMADALGLTVGELQNKVSKGVVESRDAIERMFIEMNNVNAGYAAALMDTWVGQLNRIKTAIQLLGDEIGQSGFLNEAKKSAQELFEFLQSDEVKKFAAELGVTLMETLQVLKEVAKWLWSIKDALAQVALFAGFAFAANKVLNLFSGIRQSVNASIALKRAEQAEIRRTAEVAQAAALKTAEAERNALMRRVEHYDKLAAKNVVAAANVQRAIAVTTNWRDSNIRAIQDVERRIGAYAGGRMIENHQRIVDRLNRTLPVYDNVGRGFMRAAEGAKAMSEQAALAASQKMTLIARLREGVVETGRFSKATAALGGVFNALGGWFTVAIIGIYGLIQAYQRVADQAEASARRQIAANKAITEAKEGRATEEGLTKSKDERAAIVARMETLDKARRQLTDEERKEYAEKRERLRELDESILIQEQIVDRQRQVGMLNLLETNIERENLEVLKRYQSERKAIQDLNKQETKDEYFKKKNEAEQRRVEGLVSVANRYIKQFQQEIASGVGANEIKLTANEIEARRSAITTLEGKIIQYNEDLARLMAPVREVQSNKDKPRSLTPLEQLEGKLRAELADNEANIAALLAETDKATSSVERARARLTALWNAGKFDFNVPSPRGEGRVTQRPDFKQVEAMFGLQAAVDVGNQYERLIQDLQQKKGQAKSELDDLWEAFAQGSRAVGPAVIEFDRWMNRLESQLPGGFQRARAEIQGFDADLANLRGQFAMQPLIRMSLDYANKTREIEASLTDNKKRSETEKVLAVLEAETKTFDFLLQQATATITLTEETQARIAQIRERFAAYTSARLKEAAWKDRTELQKLTEEYLDVVRSLDRASRSWSEGFFDTFIEGLREGKFEFSKFVEQILADILKIQLKQAIGSQINGAIDTGLAFLKNNLFGVPAAAGAAALPGSGGGAPGDSTVKFVGSAIGQIKEAGESAGTLDQAFKSLSSNGVADTASGLAQTVIANANQVASSTTVASSMYQLMISANAAAYALQQVAVSAASSSGSSMLQTIIGGIFGGAAGASGSATDAVIASGTVPTFNYADGGVMTKFGNLPLRAFASGGIASRPMVSVFGEGSVPEAYVPLQDGRTIPVTMSGAGGSAPHVEVNVINNTQQQVSAQQGPARWDGKKMILDVVLEGVSRPGPFRDQMRSMVKA